MIKTIEYNGKKSFSLLQIFICKISFLSKKLISITVVVGKSAT